jgi:hypothetical protein
MSYKGIRRFFDTLLSLIRKECGHALPQRKTRAGREVFDK